MRISSISAFFFDFMARFVLVLVQANEKLVSSSRKLLTPVLLFLQYELNIFRGGYFHLEDLSILDCLLRTDLYFSVLP